MEGWIKLHRQILDSDLWTDEKFTRGQAWVDLLMIACHKESSFRKRGIKVYLKRGQVGKSLDELSKRWRWSIGKVKRFLLELENETQIIIDNNNVNQIITIVNYNKYQTDNNANNNADDYTNNIANRNANDNADEMQNDMQINMQTEMQIAMQTETYKNDKNITPTHAYMREAETDLENCFNALLNDAIWYESFCMNNHLTLQQFADYLKQFFVELQNRGETSKSEKDAKHHFASWYKLNKNRNNETDRKHSKADKTRNLVTELAAYSEGGTSSLPDEEVLNW